MEHSSSHEEANPNLESSYKSEEVTEKLGLAKAKNILVVKYNQIVEFYHSAEIRKKRKEIELEIERLKTNLNTCSRKRAEIYEKIENPESQDLMTILNKLSNAIRATTEAISAQAQLLKSHDLPEIIHNDLNVLFFIFHKNNEELPGYIKQEILIEYYKDKPVLLEMATRNPEVVKRLCQNKNPIFLRFFYETFEQRPEFIKIRINIDRFIGDELFNDNAFMQAFDIVSQAVNNFRRLFKEYPDHKKLKEIEGRIKEQVAVIYNSLVHNYVTNKSTVEPNRQTHLFNFQGAFSHYATNISNKKILYVGAVDEYNKTNAQLASVSELAEENVQNFLRFKGSNNFASAGAFAHVPDFIIMYICSFLNVDELLIFARTHSALYNLITQEAKIANKSVDCFQKPVKDFTAILLELEKKQNNVLAEVNHAKKEFCVFVGKCINAFKDIDPQQTTVGLFSNSAPSAVSECIKNLKLALDEFHAFAVKEGFLAEPKLNIRRTL